MSAVTEALRAELSAAADRDDRADRAWKEATAEATAARKAYRAARKALEDALAAQEFDRTHPSLFSTGELPGGGDLTDCSGAWDGFQVVSDADPGL